MQTSERQRPVAPLRVRVVDDSSFFRAQLVRLLTADGDIEVVGQAANGQDGVAQARALRPDLITMDVEMPVMDGISAVREIMRVAPTPIVMLSSLTREGAEATLKALEAGAIDFIQKRAITADTLVSVGQAVRGRVRELVRSGRQRAGVSPSGRQAAAGPAPTARAQPSSTAAMSSSRADPRPPAARASLQPSVETSVRTAAAVGDGSWFTGCPLLVLGASTGGPAALGILLAAIPASFPVPVLVGVHIPSTFSHCFAERLNGRCALEVSEAVSGARLQPGKVLVAPGGLQTRVVRSGAGFAVEVEPGTPDLLYKPSLDYTFASVASTVGRGALAVVLTGMGSDGTQGARAIAAAGGTIWAQDEASSAVFGMPASVIKAGLASDVLSIADLAARLARGR